MRLNEFEMKKYPGVTEEMLAQMADCAGKDLVSRFMAKPTDQIAVIDGMGANISYECKKKVEGGGDVPAAAAPAAAKPKTSPPQAAS